MDFQTAQQRAQQLREQIEYYSKLYYEQDDPAISDYDFDKLMHELIDIEEAYPELLTPDSPTHRVGGKASNSFAPVEHVVQMGSLQDVFSSEEVEDFDRRVRETVPNPLYVVEPKIDGLSVSLELGRPAGARLHPRRRLCRRGCDREYPHHRLGSVALKGIGALSGGARRGVYAGSQL